MHNDLIGKRIKQFREHFGLNQGRLSEEVGLDQSVVSRIERGKQEPSIRFLNAMMLRYAANPEWIKTGDGGMFVSPEEYIAKGIKLLGSKTMSEGFLSVLKDSQFTEFQSFMKMENVTEGKIDDELQVLLQQVMQLWSQGDERTKQMLVHFVTGFPGVGEQGKKDGEK